MDLTAIYHQKINQLGYREDAEQLKIVDEMQRINDALAEFSSKQSSAQPAKGHFFKKLFADNASTALPSKDISGLYIWGGVGRGKTFLMDLFFETLQTSRKQRLHFHRFMLSVNDQLQQLRHIESPVDTLVKNLKTEMDILCLDEFFVSDITHAMLLDRLLSAMQKYGITLVTTSNIIPDDLYKNGLQRERFLPAIAWIKENLMICHLADGEDFRKRHLTADDIFRLPDNVENREKMIVDLTEITQKGTQNGAFPSGSRNIPLVWQSCDALVFDFQELCVGYYSQMDYIAIAKKVAYVGIFAVPVMSEDLENAARRFLLMIDEFYDRRVKLLLTLAAPIDSIYRGEKIAFEFDRLQSRLFEMQSKEYWEEPHRP